MTDPTFDPRLANELERYADRAVAPFDPLAIAETAIAGRRSRARRVDLRLLAIAALLVVAGGLAALAAGSWPVHYRSDVIVVAYSDGDLHAPRSALRVEVASGARIDLVRQRSNVSLAPDGRHGVFQDGVDVHLVDTRTGAEIVLPGAAAGGLTSLSLDSQGFSDSWHEFVWSPGGRWVSWMACGTGGCLGTLEAADGSRAGWIPRAGPEPKAYGVIPDWQWLDDDHLLVMGTGQHLFATTSIANGDGSNARPCTSVVDCGLAKGWGMTDAYVSSPKGVTVTWDGLMIADFAASPDDSTGVAIVGPAYPPDHGQLWLVRSDGRKVQVDLGPYLATLTTIPPVFSPDRSRMVVAALAPGQDGARALPTAFLVDLSSGHAVARLDDVALAAWSPDSGRLALVSAGNQQVEVVDRDGANRHLVGPRTAGSIDQLVWVR